MPSTRKPLPTRQQNEQYHSHLQRPRLKLKLSSPDPRKQELLCPNYQASVGDSSVVSPLELELLIGSICRQSAGQTLTQVEQPIQMV